MNINQSTNYIRNINTISNTPTQPHNTNHAFASEQSPIAPRKIKNKSSEDLRKKILKKSHNHENLNDIKKKIKNFKKEAERLIIIIEFDASNRKAHAALGKITANLKKEIEACKNNSELYILEELEKYLKIKNSAAMIYFIQQNTDIAESLIDAQETNYIIRELKNLTNSALKSCDNEQDMILLNESKEEINNLEKIFIESNINKDNLSLFQVKEE